MSRLVFFRQSGWMMIATVLSGLCMFGVHPFSRLVPEEDYGIFVLMTRVLMCLSIPSLGLQMVFARQTAAALNREDRGQLTSTIRGVLVGTFLLWGLAMIAVAVTQNRIVARWELSDAAILWLTLAAGLGALWKPIFGGVVQGSQNFLWFGLASVLEGAGRVISVAAIVLFWRRDSLAMILGVLFGMLVSILLYAWHSREFWLGQRLPFAWRSWVGNVIPLTLGFGAFQFMFGADMLFVQSWFDKDQTPFYAVAAILSQALINFTGPMVWVMFPKIVRSMAAGEKTDVFWLGLVATLGILSLGALCLSLVAPMVIQIVYGDRYVDALPLLRWFPWALVPMGVANVLLNNLMARGQFKVVKWLLVVAGLYIWALTQYHGTFLTVIRVLGLSNLTFLGVLLWFTWRQSSVAEAAATDSP